MNKLILDTEHIKMDGNVLKWECDKYEVIFFQRIVLKSIDGDGSDIEFRTDIESIITEQSNDNDHLEWFDIAKPEIETINKQLLSTFINKRD